MGVYKWWIAGCGFMAAITYSIYAALLLLPPAPLASAARPGVRLLLPTAATTTATPGTRLAAAGLLYNGCALPWSAVAAGGGNGSFGAGAGADGPAGPGGLTLPLPPAGGEEANGWWFETVPAAAAAAAGGAAGQVAEPPASHARRTGGRITPGKRFGSRRRTRMVAGVTL
jgi:hypothetical protein